MSRVVLGGLDTFAHLVQAPALYQATSSAQGWPEVDGIGPEYWVARVLDRDPDWLVLLSVDGERIDGLLVAHYQPKPHHTAHVRVAISPSREIGSTFLEALRAWANACGASRITGLTARSPKAWERRTGFRHIRDLVGVIHGGR